MKNGQNIFSNICHVILSGNPLKFKLLFDIASMYGFNVKDYKERVYILHIFELAFSSHEHRRKNYLKMADWKKKCSELQEDIHQFDWPNFQQEYRDYIDLAKLAQLIPFHRCTCWICGKLPPC